MLNPDQTKLVIQDIKDKRNNLKILIQIEQNKPLQNQDINKLDQLTEMFHQRNLILDEVQRMGM